MPGEAAYRSPAMLSGYYGDEAATREVFRDGWFHSGDMCTFGEDGLRIMVDRYKDVVKSGGENVSSIRVESVLLPWLANNRAITVSRGLADWLRRHRVSLACTTYQTGQLFLVGGRCGGKVTCTITAYRPGGPNTQEGLRADTLRTLEEFGVTGEVYG